MRKLLGVGVPPEAAACSHILMMPRMMPRKMVVFLMDSILYKVELRKAIER